MKTKIITVLCAIAASTSMLRAEISFGRCGDNLQWVLMDSVLTIDGTGEMWEYNYYVDSIPWDKQGFHTLIIPEGLTGIDNYIFGDSKNLRTIYWNARKYGYYDNNGYYHQYMSDSEKFPYLETIIFGETVDTIPDLICYRCGNLKYVSISNGVKHIEGGAFVECTKLISIQVSEDNSTYSSIDGVLFNKDKTTLLIYPSGKAGAYSVPDDVIIIADGALGYSVNLISLHIPSSVTNIYMNECLALTSIICEAVIPPSLHFGSFSLDYTIYVPEEAIEAYKAAEGWKNFTIQSIKDIHPVEINNLYYYLNAESQTAEVTFKPSGVYAGKIDIPESIVYNDITFSVTNIGDGAFACSNIMEITIPNSVINIGKKTFYGCYDLTSIKIPNSVNSIGVSAFRNCTGLTFIEIPNNVTSIENSVFYNCSVLTEIVIPRNITSIGGWAFYNCTNLTSIELKCVSPPVLGQSAFLFCDKLSEIYVPCGSLETYKQNWSKYAKLIQYHPLHIDVKVNIAEAGKVNYPQNITICDNLINMKAVPNYGYHFVQWSDGNTENPRTIELTQDTAFTAEFEKNAYTIATQVNNAEWGSTSGDASLLYLDNVEISATPDYGYHFVQWSDGNTDNPRTITVTKDETYTAVFAKNIYSINKIADNGVITGPSQAEYLDNVILEAVSNYGYHFVQWSDGNTDNPRAIELTQDTTFTAEFAVDRSGTCGDNYALRWTYDVEAKALTISGNGTLNSHYTFGVEALSAMEKLIIAEGVTTIGNRAFAERTTIKHISVPASVETIYEQAFYNCTGLQEIYSYSAIPSTAYSNTFDGINKFKCTLHVISSSIDMYKAATGWRDFYYIETIDAETETEPVEEVTVTPTETTANIIWPLVQLAASYEITIRDLFGNVIFRLVFNAQGQLTGISFAPSRGKQQEQVEGFNFTVTGLSSGTSYSYSIVAKDGEDKELDTKQGTFKTTSNDPMGIDEISTDKMRKCENAKIMRDGVLYIERDGVLYNTQGARVE